MYFEQNCKDPKDMQWKVFVPLSPNHPVPSLEATTSTTNFLAIPLEIYYKYVHFMYLDKLKHAIHSFMLCLFSYILKIMPMSCWISLHHNLTFSFRTLGFFIPCFYSGSADIFYISIYLFNLWVIFLFKKVVNLTSTYC